MTGPPPAPLAAPPEPPLALDTSVAVPLVVADHAAHQQVVRWWAGAEVHLTGHAALETYSVLTRLPGGLRLSPADAATLIERRFTSVLDLPADTSRRLPRLLADAGIAGGAAHDALVALTALHHAAVLVTRDRRARDTYQRVGASVVTVD